MRKKYVIAPYCNTYGMYEDDDFRLEKYKEKEIIQGKFQKTNTVKGNFNGREIGVFYGDNGKDYLVFTDHSARLK